MARIVLAAGQLLLSGGEVVTNTGQDPTIVSPVATHYLGYSIAETAGATAQVELYDNTSAVAGTLLDEIFLTAHQTLSLSLAFPEGLKTGVFVVIVSGAVKGVVRYA